MTAWQQAYREGGHQPWHLNARETALSFASGFLGYTGIDRVARETRSGNEAWVTVGYADPDGATAAAAVVHLARFGTGADAPWEVVGTRDTTLTLTRPPYGGTVVSPTLVGGRITGVDAYEGAIRAVWTGSRVVLNGAGFNAAYNPGADSCQKLSGQAGPGYSVFVWTGRLVIVWGGMSVGDDGAAYTP